MCMLASIKRYVPHHARNGWRLQKFHDMLHIPWDMQMFGCPQNWDASPGEHNLIDFAKRPAQRTQKRHSTFIDQVAQRLHEFSCIRKAYDTIISPTMSRLPAVGCDDDDDASHMESQLVGHHFATIHVTARWVQSTLSQAPRIFSQCNSSSSSRIELVHKRYCEPQVTVSFS